MTYLFGAGFILLLGAVWVVRRHRKLTDPRPNPFREQAGRRLGLRIEDETEGY